MNSPFNVVLIHFREEAETIPLREGNGATEENKENEETEEEAKFWHCIEKTICKCVTMILTVSISQTNIAIILKQSKIICLYKVETYIQALDYYINLCLFWKNEYTGFGYYVFIQFMFVF